MKTNLILGVVLMTAVLSIFSIDAKKPTGERMIVKGVAHQCILEESCGSKDWKKIEMSPSMYDSIANEEITMMIFLRLKNADLIEPMLLERSTPGSPLFRQWLSYDEVADNFMDLEAVKRVEDWLKFNGITQTKTAPNGEFIHVRSTVSVAERLLNTKYQIFGSETVGAQIIRAESYSLPESVFEYVDLISGVSSFPPTHPGILKGAVFNRDQEATGQVTPQLLKSYYGITSDTIQNPHIVNQSVFESGNFYSPADLAAFQRKYNIPAQTIANIVGKNQADACSNINNCAEANLDTQYITAIAQGAPTTFWEVPYEENFISVLLTWISAVAADSSPPLVHSVSYGTLEAEEDTTEMKKFNQFAATLGQRGITIVIASGDNGVANFVAIGDKAKCGFNPSFPASSPYVTAVGATAGPEAGKPEIACQTNTNCIITTGGGFSTVFSQPSYQSTAVKNYLSSGVTLPPSKDFVGTGRGYPDVALLGHSYDISVGYFTQVDGTSCSTPVFAGMISLANDVLASAGMPSLGFINPALYQLPSDVYNDITVGENNCVEAEGPRPVCCPYGFTATAGWDPLTGFGSVHFASFVSALTNVTSSA